MSILAATSRPCECSFRYIPLKAVEKGKPAGPRPFVENFSLLGNGATSGLSKRGASFTVYLLHFSINFGGKTKGLYPKFYVFFSAR